MLKERVAKLEKRSEVWDKLKPAFKFSGYIQAGYDYLWNEDGTKTSTFHLRRARMTMQGDVFKGEKGAKASYRLQIDLCKDLPIMDLWAKYQPVNQFGIQAGQFKVPVSIENTDYAATKLEFITYSQPVQRLARLSSSDLQGVNSSGRDIGLQLYGGFIKRDGFSIINYEVGVFNGTGINTKDNNKSKDIALGCGFADFNKLSPLAHIISNHKENCCDDGHGNPCSIRHENNKHKEKNNCMKREKQEKKGKKNDQPEKQL